MNDRCRSLPELCNDSDLTDRAATPYRITGLSPIRPDVSAVVHVIGLHSRQLVVPEGIGYALESRLVYCHRAEATFPPSIGGSGSTAALLLAGRKPKNKAFQVIFWNPLPVGDTKQFTSCTKVILRGSSAQNPFRHACCSQSCNDHFSFNIAPIGAAARTEHRRPLVPLIVNTYPCAQIRPKGIQSRGDSNPFARKNNVLST
jgi:hypothetical protein